MIAPAITMATSAIPPIAQPMVITGDKEDLVVVLDLGGRSNKDMGPII